MLESRPKAAGTSRLL